MTRKILFSLDCRIHKLLRHLSLDSDRPLSDLLGEAVTLLLAHHRVSGAGAIDPNEPHGLPDDRPTI
jgi:hypothetical protein